MLEKLYNNFEIFFHKKGLYHSEHNLVRKQRMQNKTVERKLRETILRPQEN